MASKHERPVKTQTLDRQLQRREANKQKEPRPLDQIAKFDKARGSPTKDSTPSDKR